MIVPILSAETKGKRHAGSRAAASTVVLIFFLFGSFGISCPVALGSDESVQPLIIVYAHNMPNFCDAIVEELRKDERIVGKVIAVDSVELLRTALLLPNAKAVVLAGGDVVVFKALEGSLIRFFDEGGGLVAFHDFGHIGFSGRMAELVFPLRANYTKMGQIKEGRMQHELVQCDVMEINTHLPRSFVLMDHEIDLAWNLANQNCSYRPPMEGKSWILYRDSVFGAPIVLAYRKEGLSVTFANGDASDFPEDRFRYFGNFFYDSVFLEIFRNSVVWVANGETRTAKLAQRIAQLEACEMEFREFVKEAEKASKSRAERWLVLRVVLTTGGTAGIALSYLLLVRNALVNR